MELLLFVLTIVLIVLLIVILIMYRDIKKLRSITYATCANEEDSSQQLRQNEQILAKHLRDLERRVAKIEKDNYSINFKVENLGKEVRSQSPFTYRKR